MTHRAGQRIAVGWRRRDVTALSVLLAAWCVYLAWTATAGGLGPGGRIATDPDKIALVRERIDPNTATAASLRRLPMIGPEKAKAIVQYRQALSRPGGRVGGRGANRPLPGPAHAVGSSGEGPRRARAESHPGEAP